MFQGILSKIAISKKNIGFNPNLSRRIYEILIKQKQLLYICCAAPSIYNLAMTVNTFFFGH